MYREIDCLIVGSGIGSLICGIVLAQQGRRVLILTEHPLEDSFCWVGEGLDHERSPELFWGWEEGGPLHHLLVPCDGGPTLVPVQPGIQVVHSHHRLGFYGAGSNWHRELRREFPGSWRDIVSCSERLSRMSAGLRWWRETSLRDITCWTHARLIGRRALGPFLRGLGLALPFCHMVEALAAACFQVDPMQTTVAMGAAALGHARRGFCAPPAGTKALAEQLIARFQGLGGKIHIGAVGEVKRRWGVIRRVAMTDGGMVSCRHVVVESEPSQGPRTINVIVDEMLIPGEMGWNVLLVDVDPTAEAPSALLHLAVGRAGNPHSPLRQKRAVTVRILKPPSKDAMEPLERAFPGWAKATICSPPRERRRVDRMLFSHVRPRPVNMRVISREGPLGCGVSAAAWSGYRVATRLLSRR